MYEGMRIITTRHELKIFGIKNPLTNHTPIKSRGKHYLNW